MNHLHNRCPESGVYSPPNIDDFPILNNDKVVVRTPMLSYICVQQAAVDASKQVA
jgi:hypothetical protein